MTFTPDLRRFALLAALLLAAPLGALPDTAKPALRSAHEALDRGDGIAAEAELVRARDAGATRDELAAAMGEALLQQGETVRARQWLADGKFAKGTEGFAAARMNRGIQAALAGRRVDEV